MSPESAKGAAAFGVWITAPDGAVVRQEGVGGAVGVVDELDVAGVGHGWRAVADGSGV